MSKVVFACFFVFVCIGLGVATASDVMMTWCVAKPFSDENTLQKNLDFLCAGVVDCSNINNGGACFEPNTHISHASVAMNKYYQKNKRAASLCEFKDSQGRPTGLVTITDPSYTTAGGKVCKYDIV